MTHLDRGDGAALGAARGALLLNELPPTRPPDRAARASSGSAADNSREAASAAVAILATCRGSLSCLFALQTVYEGADFLDPPSGRLTAGLLPLSKVLPNIPGR